MSHSPSMTLAPSPAEPRSSVAAAETRGRALAWASASLILGLLSFVHLGGLEKALLALAFGVTALKLSAAGERPRRATVGIALGAVAIVALGVVMAVFWDDVVAFAAYVGQYRR